jgi:hypothetical protein
VAKDEEIDSRDLNRLITILNRNLIFNRRAALVTGASLMAVAGKQLMELLPHLK